MTIQTIRIGLLIISHLQMSGFGGSKHIDVKLGAFDDNLQTISENEPY